MRKCKKVLALLTVLTMVLSVMPSISFAEDAQMSDELLAAYNALEIVDADDIRGNITLPKEGENGAIITWTSENESVISVKETENDNYDPTPAGVVTRGENDERVTLTATVTIGDESVEKPFELTVKAAVAEPEVSKYLMYYFKGDGNGQERIWLAGSEDGLHWNTLNNDNPIIESTLGTRGLRDPYILRSPEGDKFYLIATDLRIPSTNWTAAQHEGSKYVMVWESNDLVTWSEQRMVRVSRDDMGCTWAPEAAYDPETGEYVMFWASRMGNYQVVHYAKTRDFYSFTEPQVYIDRDPNTEDTQTTVIDTTIIKTDKGFYRFTKNEETKRIFLERADKLLGEYENIEYNVYKNEAGVEGPEIYQLNDGRYCLILDNYGAGGYFPYVTDDLEDPQYTKLDKSEYSFPPSPRHGSVIRVTEAEYKAVLDEYNSSGAGDSATAVCPDEPGSAPILEYDFEDGAKDVSGNGNDGAIKGSAEVVYDEERGNVLSLKGEYGSFLELPRGLMDGRNSFTLSMDVNSAMTGGNYFTFGLGRNQDSYFFTKVNTNGVKAAITTTGWQHEEIAEYGSDSTFVNTWRNVTFTVTETKLSVYVDGILKTEKALSENTVSKLGQNLKCYIGKSMYTGDSYAKMKLDNVKIYNYALDSKEIAKMFVPEDELGRYSLRINADEKGADITEGMFGLFFEDINYAADGGMYSEVINNRSFEAYSKTENKMIPYYGWSLLGSASAAYPTDAPLNSNNPTYLRLTAAAEGDGIENDCYLGFSARAGEKYNVSVYARGDYEGNIAVEVTDTEDNVIGSGSFGGLTDEFRKYELVLKLDGSCKNAKVRLVLDKAGTVDMDMVSVLPKQTFNGRDNGLRADLVEKLAELRPGFLRFPGGCIVEGFDLSNRYQWKHTVGPVEQRVQNWNRWQSHNEYHEGNGMYGYCQTYGLGFYEYFLLCEDIGAKAVPVVNVGIGCQYQTGEASSWDDLYDIYIPDALDLIEFANGEPDENWKEITLDMTDSASFNDNWANVRAVMGHPKSFEMEYIGIGNEQWNTNENRFFERYEAFEAAIHEQYPEMKLISTSGPLSDGGDFDNAWNWLKTHSEDKAFTYAVDEHYYKDPQWFYDNINRYDTYDRNGFGVFAGEYASRWWSGYPRGNTLETALSEAAYMTGLEKNSDIVKMASYAPLFAKLGATQWTPDMIWFDTDTSYGSVDYYVQKLFSRNIGSYNIKNSVVDSKNDTEFHGRAGVGTWLTSAKFSDYKVTDNKTGEDITPNGFVEPQESLEPEKHDYTVSEWTAQQEDGGNLAVNVSDGDLATRWAAQGKGQYIICDLGEVKMIGQVGVAALKSGSREYFYEIWLSEDGENYSKLFDGSNGSGNGDVVYTLAGNVDARYIKIVGNGNNDNDWSSITEVEIYGETAQEKEKWIPRGEWTKDEDGSWEQSDISVDGAALFTESPIRSNDFTLTVKATKTGGAEGFIIPILAKDGDNLIHWNIGGWGNRSSAFEKRENASNYVVSAYAPTVLETGREYEIKIVYSDGTLWGYLDGVLLNTYKVNKTEGPVYSSASYDEKTGDIIVKLVNSENLMRKVAVSIGYSGEIGATATEYLLSGRSLSDKNSIDEPEKLSVSKRELDGISDEFEYELPELSVAVLRIHTGGNLGVVGIGEVSISTKAGTAANLPEKVVVKLSDGSEEERNVAWRITDSGVFANEGCFKVYGIVDGTETDAVAMVIVEEAQLGLIEVDTSRLLAGEEAEVVFTAPDAGKYRGVLAVYADGKLEYVKTVEFSGKTAMELKLDDEAKGKTVKLMLWDDESIAPMAEAVTVTLAK